MAKSFLVPINLNQQEVQNAVIQVLGTDPGSPVNGQIWINPTSYGTATGILPLVGVS